MQSVLGVADWVLASCLPQLLPLFDASSFFALRSYHKRVFALPAFKAASSVWASAQALLSPSYDSVNPSASISDELVALFTAATLKAFPMLRYHVLMHFHFVHHHV